MFFCLQVATGQVASTGMVALSYVQKLSEKVHKVMLFRTLGYILSIYSYYTVVFVQVSLASDLMYNHTSRDVTASVGYDYVLRQVDYAIIVVKKWTDTYISSYLMTGNTISG